VNVAEEAVAEELLPCKELFTNSSANAMKNSSANATNSKAPNHIAKVSDSIAKATN